jgi:hypothetical protein
MPLSKVLADATALTDRIVVACRQARGVAAGARACLGSSKHAIVTSLPRIGRGQQRQEADARSEAGARRRPAGAKPGC